MGEARRMAEAGFARPGEGAREHGRRVHTIGRLRVAWRDAFAVAVPKALLKAAERRCVPNRPDEVVPDPAAHARTLAVRLARNPPVRVFYDSRAEGRPYLRMPPKQSRRQAALNDAARLRLAKAAKKVRLTTEAGTPRTAAERRSELRLGFRVPFYETALEVKR